MREKTVHHPHIFPQTHKRAIPPPHTRTQPTGLCRTHTSHTVRFSTNRATRQGVSRLVSLTKRSFPRGHVGRGSTPKQNGPQGTKRPWVHVLTWGSKREILRHTELVAYKYRRTQRGSARCLDERKGRVPRRIAAEAFRRFSLMLRQGRGDT